MTDTTDQDREDDDAREWFDGEHQSRATADPDTEALIDKFDSLPSETRLAVIKAVRSEHAMNGGNFDAAIRTFRDPIESAEPSEDVRADNPDSNPARGVTPKAGDGAFMPDAFPSMRSGRES